MAHATRGGGIIIIGLTILVALVLTLIPLPGWASSFRPEWLVLVLIYWAMALPERMGVTIGWLAGLMLVDSSGAPVKREGSTPIGFRIAQTPVLRDLAKYFMPRSIFENSLKQSVSNQEIVTEAEVDRYWEMARYPGNRDATMKRFRTPRVTYNAEQVAGLDLPVLVMWGEEDALTAVTGAHWYSEHLPSDTLVIYEGVGHLPQQEHAEQSAADVLTWLGTLSKSALEESGVEEPVG